MKIENEQDFTDRFGSVMKKEFNGIVRQSANNIRTARIVSIDSTARTANVVIDGTNESLNKVKYSRGITGISENDSCLIISQDPSLKGQSFIVGVFR